MQLTTSLGFPFLEGITKQMGIQIERGRRQEAILGQAGSKRVCPIERGRF